MRSKTTVVGIIFILLIGLSFMGCGSAKLEPQPVEMSLQKLVVVYGQYLSRHRGSAPADEQALRKSIEELSESERAGRGLDDLDSLFVSPRDKQPYVVRYGGKIGAPGPKGAPWIAHEKVGQGGKRFVGYATGQMEEVDEARLQQLLSQ